MFGIDLLTVAPIVANALSWLLKTGNDAATLLSTVKSLRVRTEEEALLVRMVDQDVINSYHDNEPAYIVKKIHKCKPLLDLSRRISEP